MTATSAGHSLHKEIEAARVLLSDFRDILGDDVEARADAIEGQTELLEAIERGMRRVAEVEAMEAGLQAMMGNLKARLERLSKQKENLRTSLAVAMELSERKRLETAVGTIVLKPVPPQVEITDEAAIPSQFWKAQEPKLDKAALKAALNAKEIVPGAVLGNGGMTVAITGR